MKTYKIVTGVILIILGILFLFANLNIISWDFLSGMWKLWPLILVLGGLDMIMRENHLLKTIVLLFIVLLAFIIYFFSRKGDISTSLSGGDNANCASFYYHNYNNS